MSRNDEYCVVGNRAKGVGRSVPVWKRGWLLGWFSCGGRQVGDGVFDSLINEGLDLKFVESDAFFI